MGLYLPLDVTWPDDDDVIEVGLEGAGLHAITMCLAKRGGKDGWVGRRSLARYGGTPELVALLVANGLLEADENRVRPVGWLKRNPSQAAIEQQKIAKRIAGIRGNHSRWHDGDFETCPACKAQVVALCDTGAIAEVIPSETVAIAKRREGESAIAPDPVAAIKSQQRGSDDAARLARLSLRSVPDPSTQEVAQ